MLSPHERWELEKPSSPGPSIYADLLSLRYPAYKDRIVKARAAGYTDDEILPRLQEREAKALLYYPADQVNERIGRTPETINSIELYERRHLRDAYVKAYEGKLTEQEVDERLVAAELLNVQAPLLLRDDGLYKKLAGHIKMREGWLEAAWNGAVRDRLNKDESSLGMRLIYGEESEDLWKQLDELDRLQQQYMPARDPSFSGSVKRGVGGAVEVLAQYVKGGYRGATTYGPTMAAAAGSAAAVMNAPAFTNPITAPAGLAATGSAMVTGFGAGMLLGAGMENFEREAGGAMVEYCRMKDNQGRPMDRNAARVAAVLTGVVNAGLEHFQLSTFLKNVPGGDRLVKFFSKSGMKKLLTIPTVRSALAEIGKKYIGGIATESIQEMAQETATILGGELGKILSGQEFAGLDLEESIDRILETGAQTVGTMAVSFLPGMAMNTVSGVRHAKVMQKGAEQTAASLGISTDELMARVNAPDDPAQGRAVDGLGENAQPSGPAMKDGVQLGPTREAAAKLEAQAQAGAQTQAQAQGHAVDGLGENGAEEDTNVYLPAQAIESYNQENPGLLEDLGIVVEPVEGTSEVRLTAEQYEALEDVAPELAEAVKNDVRRGSKGMTTREVGETLKKKAEKPAWRTAEVDGITKELEQKALGAGLDKAEARQWSKTAGAFIGVTSKRYNVAPSELARMKLRQGTEITQGESFGQPVNPGVNLGQKVPILDLSGKIPDAQRATPQELLDFLKAEFVGKEPSISADGEAMIGLPSNSAAKHVVRSSWKGLTYEDMDTRTAGLMSLRDVLQNATLIESHPNQKASKTHLKNIHRFYIPVWSSDGLKTLRIVAHESKNSDGRTPVEVDLNDLIVERQDAGPARLSGTPLSGVLPERQLRGALEVTIADMLRGVKDAEGKPYVGEKYNQSAYNGSPALYDKFDMSKVGSGNGTASYGWGANLSSAREVAELYVRLAGGFGENVQVAKFDIPENDVLLSYDKRFSEQPQKVKDALQPYADEYKQSNGERGIKIYDVFSGAQIQEKIADALNEGRISVEGGLNGPVEANSREVSMFLNSLGIPGLRYPDDGGKGDNFVIWDENVMHMLERESNGKVETFAPAPQSSVRQSEEYDYSDPKTWPAGAARDEALELQAWQHLEDDDEIETWPESPEKDRALELQNEIRQIDEWIENLSREEFDRRLWNDDPEFVWKNEHGVELEKELHALRRILRKKKPKEIERRLLQLIEAEEEAAAQEAEEAENARIDAEDAEEYYQIIGKRGAKALDKAKEGTVRLDNLNVAREMEQSGKDAKTIRLATGWERGADGKWRYEIPDGTFRREGFISNPDLLEFRELERKFIDGDITEGEQARLKELTPIVRETRKPSRLSDFYDAPELYAAYPELADISVKFQDRYGEGKGSYSPSENTISLDMDLRGDAAKTVLVHEIQHAIQRIEGFARGGSPSGMWLGQARKHTLKIYKELRAPLSLEEYAKNAWQTDEVTDEIRKGYKEYLKTATNREADRAAQEGAGRKAYHHLGGEVEARNAERRTRLSDEERKERLLSETEDVAREDQIILEEMMEAYSTQQPEIAENIRRGPLTFKLTGEPVSGEYMAALEKLEAGEPVAAEEYNAIPEIQDARGRTATGSTLGMPGREAIRKQVYDELMSYGSAVTEVVDGQKRTVYNGEVRNDRRADIIIGLPASGKSSALVDPISSKYKSMLIDSDEAKKLIPEFDDGFGAGYVHAESKDIVGRVYDDVTDEGKNVVIPIVGSSYAKLKDEYINDLHQKGYKVYVHMADINPNVAAGRNLRRFAETGRFVDLEATSFKYGNKPREVFERIKKEGVADGYSRIDTTVFPGGQVEGTEDIPHDRGDLREGRRSVLGSSATEKGRESSQAGAAGGAAAGLGAERAGGYSRMGTAPRGVSAHPSDINARLTVQPDGVSLIEFFKNANRSTSFHELAHHMFRVIYELSGRDGVDPQLIEDVNTILREAGVTREEFDANTNGARTRVHEFFARGFEVYISEGKAPSKELRGVFRRLRAWMIEVYHDVVQALGIELSDEMRGVYDRLLAMPEEIDAETTVRELAVEEAALKEEIQRHEAEMREREAQERISIEGGEEWASPEIPEGAAEVVDGWLSELESYEIGRAARAEVRKTLDHIREEGGLNFERLAFLMGDEAAGELRKKLGNFYFTSKKALSEGRGLPLDVLAEVLGMDENGLVAFLEGIEGGKLKKPAPLLEVNTDTLNALVDRLGVEGARSYLKDRARYLVGQQKAIQQEYDRDKNNAQVKADLEATYREQREIADGLRALEGTLKAEADIAPEVSIEPVSLTPESGRSIDEAEDSELLLTADGSTELGRIDEDVAKAAGIAAGEIRANVGAVRHAEEGHGAQILGAGYPDATTFIFDVLSGYEKIFRGSNESLLLGKPLGDHHAIAAIELVNEDGIYRTKTGWVIRERALNKKELLFARSEPLAADPGAGVVSRTGPNKDREGAAPNAKQKSNSAATVPPGKANVNPMLTLSEAMRRGYEMAEKYARAAFKAGREAEAEKLTEFKEKAAERLAGFKERAAGKLDRVKEEAEGKLDELEVKRRLQLGSERAKAAMKRAELKKEAAERVKSERAKAQMRIAALKQKLQERQKLKKEVNKLVKGINKMAGDSGIDCLFRDRIQAILEKYDLKKRRQETLDRRAELEEYLKENPEAADTMNTADLKYLGTRTLNDMTLDDLRTLKGQIEQLHREGREDLEARRAERREYQDRLADELAAPLLEKAKTLPQRIGAVKGPSDLDKLYVGTVKAQKEGEEDRHVGAVKGKAAALKDKINFKTLNPLRIFDLLDGGRGTREGAWVRCVYDPLNNAFDEEIRGKTRRKAAVAEKMADLGLSPEDLATRREVKGVPSIDGKGWKVEDLLSIYAAMQYETGRKEILFGNFKNLFAPGQWTLEAAEHAAGRCIQALTDEERAFAHVLFQDGRENFSRIQKVVAEEYNISLQQEELYMRHHVLEHDSNQGLSVLYEDDKLNDAKADAGLMGDLERGFIISRKNIPDGERKGIKLGMYSIWLSQVDDQEHMIAFVRPLRDIRAALTMKNPADPDMTLSKLIRETWGLEGWRAVVDYYNVMTQDEAKLMRGLLDDEFGGIMRNFIATRLAWNWVTYIRQMYSLPLVLPYSGWTSLMSSMAEAVRDGGDFLERVYEMAPEIAERKGDIWAAALRAHEGATGLYKEILDKGLAPIGLIDQVIAAVVFKAVYNAQRKNGASHDKAVREGKHVVALTQSASHAKDATRLMREKGAMKFFTIFTSDLAQAWGCVVYDIPAALKDGNKQKALALIATLAITKLLEQMVRDGGPDEWDDPWEWAEYVAGSSAQNLLETVPLYGKVLSGAFDYAVHGGQFRSTSIPLYEGVRVLAKGARGAITAKDKEKAMFDLMDGVGLLTGGVPTVFIRRTWKIGEAMSEGEYKEAFKEAIGMRRDERRTRRKIWM